MAYDRPACGTQLLPTRGLHKCGAHLRGAQATGWQAGLPWALAGLALGALIAVVALRLMSGPTTTSAQTASPPMRTGGTGMAPDISQMSPEERATRLYNRVMTLHAAGKNDSAEFFLPMALQAYAMVPAPDIDAHYHMGVLRLTGGDAAGALAEADSIRRRSATHLFGFVLRAQALEPTRAGETGYRTSQERGGHRPALPDTPITRESDPSPPGHRSTGGQIAQRPPYWEALALLVLFLFPPYCTRSPCRSWRLHRHDLPPTIRPHHDHDRLHRDRSVLTAASIPVIEIRDLREHLSAAVARRRYHGDHHGRTPSISAGARRSIAARDRGAGRHHGVGITWSAVRAVIQPVEIEHR